MNAKQAAEMVSEHTGAKGLAEVKAEGRSIDRIGRRRNIKLGSRRDRRSKRQWKRSAARRRAAR